MAIFAPYFPIVLSWKKTEVTCPISHFLPYCTKIELLSTILPVPCQDLCLILFVIGLATVHSGTGCKNLYVTTMLIKSLFPLITVVNHLSFSFLLK